MQSHIHCKNKRVFIFVAASAFGVDHKNKLFDYVINTSYCLWDPLTFAFKPQDNKNQLQAAFFSCKHCVYFCKQRPQEREKKEKKK